MVTLNKHNLFSCRKSDIVSIGAGSFFLWNSDKEEFIDTVLNMNYEKFTPSAEMARGVMFEDLLYYCIDNKILTPSIDTYINLLDIVSDNLKYPNDYKTYFKQFSLNHYNNVKEFLANIKDFSIIKPKMVNLDFNLNWITIRVRGIPDFVLLNNDKSTIVELKTSARTDIKYDTINNDIRNCEDYTAFYCKCHNFNSGRVSVFSNIHKNSIIGQIAVPTLIEKDISSKIPTIENKMFNMCLEIEEYIRSNS